MTWGVTNKHRQADWPTSKAWYTHPLQMCFLHISPYLKQVAAKPQIQAQAAQGILMSSGKDQSKQHNDSCLPLKFARQNFKRDLDALK